MKWLFYTRGTIHPHRLSALLGGLNQYSDKQLGMPFHEVLYINEVDKVWWGWNKKEMKEIGNCLIKLCSNRKSRSAHFKKFENCSNSAIRASEKIRKIDLNRLTDKQLIEAYDYLYDNTAFALAITNILIDAVDIIFENYLQTIIKNELPVDINKNELLKLYKNLLVSNHVSYIQKQELKILQAASKKKVEDASKIYEKYWWTKLGWENMEPYIYEDFKNEIKKNTKKNNIDNKIKLINRRSKDIKNQRASIIKSYRLSNEIVSLLETLDKYTYFHDLRKEMQVRTTYAAHLLMVEAARRRKLNKNDLEWLTYDEVKEIIKGKRLDKIEVEKRKRNICIIIDKRGYRLYSGEEAIKIKNKEFKEARKQVNEFKGTGVCKGKIVSKVKVCNGAVEALRKVKKGDILVCGMTLPDYVPAMKLAKAIITDEGGITCHAAIISRELGIPCIVGAKIATRVLKDGDEVEVDADKGIVKILKK
ncbi:MAG: PEP-utilizing enzyme [bacterium]